MGYDGVLAPEYINTTQCYSGGAYGIKGETGPCGVHWNSDRHNMVEKMGHTAWKGRDGYPIELLIPILTDLSRSWDRMLLLMGRESY